MKDKLHILIIPSWYPRYEGDIGGSFFREQALAINKHGHKVGVLSLDFLSLKNLSSLSKISLGFSYLYDSGLYTYKYHAIKAVPKSDFLIKKLWVKIGLYMFKKYILEQGMPDIIHVHSIQYAGHLALTIHNLFKIPYVITEHSSAFDRKLISKNKLKEILPIVNYSSCNIAVSNKFSNLLNYEFNLGHWQYIPNIVSNDFLDTKGPVKYSNNFIFTSIGSLTKNKSIDKLILSYNLIKDDIPNSSIHIIGDGPEKKNLIKLVNHLKLNRHIKFFGSIDRKRVKEELSKSSVLVLPSKYETFGVVIIEALALGKPVVATKCGGPQSILNEQVGVLVDNHSIKELAAGMLYIYENYDTYIPEDIKEYCLYNFSEKVIVRKLESIYYSVLT